MICETTTFDFTKQLFISPNIQLNLMSNNNNNKQWWHDDMSERAGQLSKGVLTEMKRRILTSKKLSNGVLNEMKRRIRTRNMRHFISVITPILYMLITWHVFMPPLFTHCCRFVSKIKCFGFTFHLVKSRIIAAPRYTIVKFSEVFTCRVFIQNMFGR
jgi:hypothetical protein